MTDSIFEQLAIVNKQAKDDPTILRLSLDAPATVKVGDFSRGGKTRAAEGVTSTPETVSLTGLAATE